MLICFCELRSINNLDPQFCNVYCVQLAAFVPLLFPYYFLAFYYVGLAFISIIFISHFSAARLADPGGEENYGNCLGNNPVSRHVLSERQYYSHLIIAHT